MKTGGWAMIGIVMALVAGQGIHWFVSGASAGAAPGRPWAVGLQVLVASAIAIHAEVQRHRTTPVPAAGELEARAAGLDL
jgi:hypothetical protein